MKTVYKILILLFVTSFLISCSKDEINESKCDCYKTKYKSQTYIVVNNGLPSLRNRKTTLGIEKNIGCFPEGVTSLGSGISYEIKCVNY